MTTEPEVLEVYKADHVAGRVRLWTVADGPVEVDAPCVAYVPHDSDAEAELNTGRLRQVVQAVEREEWAGGRGWLRVEARPRYRWELADALKGAGLVPHEADVSPARRYLSESDAVRVTRRPVVAFVDIECDSRVPFHQHVLGGAAVLRVSWAVGVDGDVRTMRLPWLADRQAWERAERDMLGELQRRLARDGVHVLVGWNSQGYDEPALKKRGAVLGLDESTWDRWLWLDQMRCTMSHFQRGESGDERVSFALDSMAAALGGERKVDLRGALAESGVQTDARSPSVVWEAYSQRPEILDAYNRGDVLAQQSIERRKGFVGLQVAIAATCRTPPGDRSLYKSELADGVFLRVGRRTGVHFRTKPPVDERQPVEQAQGADILEVAAPGVYRDVAVLDFAGMYTSIIVAGNMSPDTLLRDGDAHPHCEAPNGARFRTDVDGIFPRVIRQLRKRRAEAKARAKLETDPQRQVDVAQESDSLKILINAMYGLLLSAFSRYYEKACGEAVTASARAMLGILCREVERAGGRVLMGDTDSAGAQVPEALRTPCPEGVAGCWHVDVSGVERLCAEWGRERGYPAPDFQVEHETTFLNFMITRKRGEERGAKKRYAGSARYYKGAHLAHAKLEVKGLETMRGKGEAVMRRMLGDVLVAALLGGADASEARALVDPWRARALGGRLTAEDLVLHEGISKPLDEYEAASPHVEVARRLAAAGWPVGAGTKVEYLIAGREPGGRLRAVHPSEWDGKYDARVAWDERVYEPTRQVLEVLYPGYDWAALESAGPGAQQGDLFAAPKPEPPSAARPGGDGAGDAVVVQVGARASRGDLVRLWVALRRSPGPRAVALRFESGVDVALGPEWGCDPAALARELGPSDRISVAWA